MQCVKIDSTKLDKCIDRHGHRDLIQIVGRTLESLEEFFELFLELLPLRWVEFLLTYR